MRARARVALRIAGALGLFLDLLVVTACQPSVAATAPAVVSPPTVPTLSREVTSARVAPGAPKVEAPRLADLARRARDVWLAAFVARDADKLASVYAEEGCITSPGRPPVCGRSAIAEATRAAWAKLPEMRTAWGRTWQSGDLVVVESAWSAEAKGAAALALSWFTPDGLIREERVYADERSVSSPPGATGRARPFDGLPTTRESHEAKGAPDEQANVELLRTSFSAPAPADDAELVDFTQPGSLVGKKYAARWTGARAGELAGAHAAMTHAWGVEGYVVCEYETTGTRRASHGEAATLHGAEVLQIEDGKVKRGWRYGDSLELSPVSGAPAVFLFAVP
jgi:ketosteroid isomerase-like protein